MKQKTMNTARSEENNRLIELARQGNEKAFNKLIETNRPLCIYFAKKFPFSGIDYDDLISISMYAMYKAYLNFDISRGISFCTVAGRYMEMDILNQMRHDKRHTVSLLTTVSTDEIIEDDNGHGATFGETLSDPCEVTDPCDIYIGKEEKRVLTNIINNLSDNEKILAKARWAEGKTQQETAKLLNTNQVFVLRLERKIMKKIKFEFEKQYA
jgi:RNA polymerase sigma factor (sigma-70 family)